ncbi:glutamate racemase [Methylobacterium sp. J-072]|uniref:glutamate racemase n=1 Tax=Methylobacterium sp. J-072 TaxID=2836651 RepID=UPI001FB9E021|nr:glutamate racemase [Methylobacterium sp. J-072]MCJ2097148.1 glutamate racemase [Methylobacterium sp. J-072]
MNIGVFDSGSGGLTVARALDDAFPARNFIYLGDHANAPYGDRSVDEIYRLTIFGLERLFQENCSLVVVACNTAAARGLRRLQREWLPVAHPTRRVLGVIVPVVEEVTGVPWTADQKPLPRSVEAPNTTVAVFATKHTVESRAFAGEIYKRAPHIEVWQEACPRLVPLIESDAPDNVIESAVGRYVISLKDRMSGRSPDVCILGCTHYPLIEPIFRKFLPFKTRILSQPSVTARSLADYLKRHPEFPVSTIGTRRFLTTGKPELASRIASRFYGRAITF